MTTTDPLGCDIACTTGFPLVMRLCWGDENLQNASIRRLNADEGCLESIGDDPDYGFNLTKQLNKSFDGQGDMAALGSRVRAELEKDVRFANLSVRALTGDNQLVVPIEGESVAGPFSLVVYGDMSVDRMNPMPPVPTVPVTLRSLTAGQFELTMTTFETGGYVDAQLDYSVLKSLAIAQGMADVSSGRIDISSVTTAMGKPGWNAYGLVSVGHLSYIYESLGHPFASSVGPIPWIATDISFVDSTGATRHVGTLSNLTAHDEEISPRIRNAAIPPQQPLWWSFVLPAMSTGYLDVPTLDDLAASAKREATTSQSTGDPLGVDIACTTGFPLVMRLCWGVENLQNACLRRLNADEGCLESIGDDPDYGFNLTGQLNKSFDGQGDMAALGSRVRAELEKDVRVASLTARILTGQGQLTVAAEGESAAGPFSLVVAVGQMTVDQMNQGLQQQGT